MKLLYTPTSPFARKVTMFLHYSGLINSCDLVIANPFESEELRTANPLGKVPALIDGNTSLFESNLILEYLNNKADTGDIFQRDKPDYFNIQKNHFLAEGILNAAVSHMFERKRETEHSQYWLDRWEQAIITSIETVEIDHLGNTDTPNIATLTMATALGYLNFRLENLDWRSLNQDVCKWDESIRETSWYQQTIPADPK